MKVVPIKNHYIPYDIIDSIYIVKEIITNCQEMNGKDCRTCASICDCPQKYGGIGKKYILVDNKNGSKRL